MEASSGHTLGVGLKHGATESAAIAVLRVVAVAAGATFAVHRLALGLHHPTANGGPPTYLSTIGDVLTADGAVLRATGRTILLAAPALAVALVLGALGAGLASIARWIRRLDRRPGPGAAAVAVLSVAVPGVAWLPAARLAIDRGLVPADPAVVDQGGLPGARFLGFWALLAGLAVAPTVAGSLGRASTRRAGGEAISQHPTPARLSGGSPIDGGRAVAALPTATFGLALATAEVASGHPGLFASFADEAAAGRIQLLVPLTLVVVIGGLALSSAGDLVHRLREWPDGPHRPAPGSDPATIGPSGPAVGAVALAGLFGLWTIGAGIGAALDPPPLAEAGLGPRAGGPWLGTDPAGRSVAFQTAAALGPALLAALLPAMGATAVGAGLTLLRATVPRSLVRLGDAMLGLLSWPLALVVPLAAWSAAGSAQPLLDRSVLVTTGLALVPMAARLLRPWKPRPALRAVSATRTGAVASLLAAVALAAHLLAGLVGPGSPSRWVPLGQLIGEGFDGPGPLWPLVGPAGAATLTMAGLLGSSTLLAGRAAGRAERPPGDEPEAPGPATAPALPARPDRSPEPPVTSPTVSPPGAGADLGPGDEIDIRDEVSVGSAIDFDPERDATSTVELRPSDFRQRPEDRQP